MRGSPQTLYSILWSGRELFARAPRGGAPSVGSGLGGRRHEPKYCIINPPRLFTPCDPPSKQPKIQQADGLQKKHEKEELKMSQD
ncbi:hypothetical protein EYF80_041474 [Liparis tanakae]|uniref:Uncharacterized protein n=1 Tax=Liparis tanakae TaxID=230148 RepID=A0A4Z2G6Y2_9TELE|nr:hypothetical protein EYF80_041474 [Liparis tanakae]